MKLIESRNGEIGENVYEFRIRDSDIAMARLSKNNHSVIDRCSKSGLVSDRLLLLHTVALAVERGHNGGSVIL